MIGLRGQGRLNVAMSLDQVAAIAQIAGSVGIVLSLVFVGVQVRQNTAALYRNEHNSTMAQWTVIRMGIAQNRDIAELMTTGLSTENAIDPANQLRLEQLLQEQLWASFHIWDREQRGVFAKGTYESAVGAYVTSLLATARQYLVEKCQVRGLLSSVRCGRGCAA